MKRAAACIVLLMALLAIGLASAAPVVAARQTQARPSPITVELDKSLITAGPGEKIIFKSTVLNTGDEPISGLIAHVNILSSDPDVYVDPEDWSPRRTQFLEELSPGDDAVLTWDVQAVTAGPLVLYVAVTQPESNAMAVSGPLLMTVGGRRVVDSGGVFPLVVGMPAAVLTLIGLAGVRSRRRR